jgi:radical SAM protein with 4Fe4S-binding SPASM domain
MANLVVSSVCNLHCDYCFAREFLNGVEDEAFISLESFERRLDFLEKSGIKDARLIGGEPGLHPHFETLLQMAEGRFQNIVVFSNGLLSDRALEALAGLPPERLTVMVNLSAGRAEGDLSEAEQSRRAAGLRRLGKRAMAAFTIARLDFDLERFIPLIQESGCRSSMRLGLAQPVSGGENRYLHPKQYPAAGKRIVTLAQKMAEVGMRVEFDCGFVRCMFSKEDLDDLSAAGTYAEWRCNAVLDIDLAGRVSHCFPLAEHFNSQIEENTCAAELRDGFAARTRPYRVAGIFKACSSCDYKRQQECTGGCLAAAMLRFKGNKETERAEKWKRQIIN